MIRSLWSRVAKLSCGGWIVGWGRGSAVSWDVECNHKSKAGRFVAVSGMWSWGLDVGGLSLQSPGIVLSYGMVGVSSLCLLQE